MLVQMGVIKLLWARVTYVDAEAIKKDAENYENRARIIRKKIQSPSWSFQDGEREGDSAGFRRREVTDIWQRNDNLEAASGVR